MTPNMVRCALAPMVVGQLVTRVRTQCEGGRVQCAEQDDQQGDDDEQAHDDRFPSFVVTCFIGLIGY